MKSRTPLYTFGPPKNNPMQFPEWLAALNCLVSSPAKEGKVFCPKCKNNTLVLRYVGDPKTRIGYLRLWCSACCIGIHISRAKAPPWVKMLSFDEVVSKESDLLPEFKEIVPD